ncbi:MAG: hypothetical protein AB7T06_22040 [Kofleriaceae bacterium]
MADSTDARAAELASLRQDLESLRTTVAALESELRNAHGRIELTMRNQQRCRACGNRKIAHALSILDRADSNMREPLALNRPSWWSSKTQGELEAFVCMKCGLVEWWVKEPDSLRPHEDYLTIIDEPDPNGPYR